MLKPFDLRPSPNKNIDSSQYTTGTLLFYCWTSGILSLKPWCRSSGLLQAAFNALYWFSLRSTPASITLRTTSINLEQSAAQRRRELCLPQWRGETWGEVWGSTTHVLPNSTWCLYVRSQLRPRHHWVCVRDGQTDWWCRDQRRLCWKHTLVKWNVTYSASCAESSPNKRKKPNDFLFFVFFHIISVVRQAHCLFCSRNMSLLRNMMSQFRETVVTNNESGCFPAQAELKFSPWLLLRDRRA